MFSSPRKNLVYIVILLIPFFLFFSRTGFFQSVIFQINQLTIVPARILAVPFLEFKKIVYYHRTFDEYRRLRYEVDVLKARLVGMEEVIRENSRLEHLLTFKRQLIHSSITAHVIGRNPSHWNDAILIDKGYRDGVKEGQPVVSASGVVGKITDVGARHSKVILVTDPQFSVTAMVQRAREIVMVSGTLKERCRLRYVSQTADIQLGDQIITSALGTSYPDGLLIGEVVRIEGDVQGQSVEYIVQPAVAISQIEEVLVISD